MALPSLFTCHFVLDEVPLFLFTADALVMAPHALLRDSRGGVRYGFRATQRLLFLLLRLCALCVCVSVLTSRYAYATLIASSKISRCTNTGDDPANCTKKMVVTLTVEAGQQAGEESLVFLNSAEDETASAGTTTSSAATTVSFAPIAITTSRSAVRYRYPVFYVQNYNAKPYEATVKGRLLNQCNADFNPNTATCGIAYGVDGKAIPFSQGFCCDCSMCQTLGFCEPGARANKACNVFDEYTTASCLRFGQRWYSGYTIGTYVTWFTLNVTVTRNTTATGDNGVAAAVVRQTVVLQLSPSVLGAAAGGGWGASARLVGSFAPTDQPLDLTAHMLFAPALPLTDERVRAGATEWILLPKTLVSLDGRECNKVGVSYEAFASQGNMCNLSPGSCLSSQLEDYRTADLSRMAAGKKAQYMATGYGNFDLEREANTTSTGKVSPYISYVAASPAATMVVLTVDADGLEYIVGVADGKIVSAALNQATIEASSTDGVLLVVVRNVAAATGRLVVSVQSCTTGVFPMAAQTLSLSAQQQSTLRFNVYMQDIAAPGNASCTVVVYNSEDLVTDTRVVSWTVAATNLHNGTQGDATSGGGGGGTTEEPSAASCSACGTLNIVCAVRRQCWGLVLLDLIVYIIVAAAIFCMIWFRRIFCCCFYRTRGGGHRSHCRSEHDGSRNSSAASGSRHRHHHRRHSPTREESGSSSSGASRRGRSRKLPCFPNSSGPSQRHSRHRHHRRSSGSPTGAPLRDAVVGPHLPLMTYAATPVHALSTPYCGTAAGAATSTSPFSSPLRVQPPPSNAHRDADWPSRPPSTAPDFSPTFLRECAAFSASPPLLSLPPPLPPSPPSPSCWSTAGGGLHSPASSLSPLTPPFSARGTRSEYDYARENALRWQACRGDGGGASVQRISHVSTLSPLHSATRDERAPFM